MPFKLAHDAFARESGSFRLVPAKQGGCDFCGGTRANGKLAVYTLESDGGRKSQIRGEFCSVACLNSYHG